MRSFICCGGSHDGKTINIKHGRRVIFPGGEVYRVYSEPLEWKPNNMGVLIPESMTDEAQITTLLEEKFPWYRARPTSGPKSPEIDPPSDR